MKDIFKKGFFAVLMILLIGFLSIPENSIELVQEDLSNQIKTEQTIDLVSVDYAFEVSEISTHSILSEQNLIALQSESHPEFSQTEGTHFGSTPLQEGIRDETLSSEYWSETNQLVPRFRPSIYFA